MKTIRISQDVWDAMAKVGKFGETPDDVLKRVFGIDEADTEIKPLRRIAQKRMTTKVENDELLVGFEDGQIQTWALPSRSDKLQIKKVREAAINFATNNGATVGQLNAVRKALTEAGYHLTK